MFKDEINIAGFIDNSADKIGTTIEGIPCYAFNDINLENDEAIILTMSQIARVKPAEQLLKSGKVHNVDYFLIEEFISVYNVYKYDKVYFSSISFLPSTICNLNCKHCLNFNPYAKQFYVREWETAYERCGFYFFHVWIILCCFMSVVENQCCISTQQI